MKSVAKVITVFGSSHPRPGEACYEQARELGASLTRAGFTICSGGYAGVMEAVSRGAKEAGGRTIAVTARFFRAQANPWVDQEMRVRSWQDRLFELIRRGEGYVVCPGGTGTLVELSVVWEMINKGVMNRRPVVSLGSFWRPVVECVRTAEIGPESVWLRNLGPLVHFAESPSEAAEYLARELGAE
ncbi:MAG TPA: LOG family protein [Candidatus Cybelea sp.]|nr:LOG family protein [Candidatus Cybelea sp.]